MEEKRSLLCITCPLGCRLEVSIQDGKIIDIRGNGCKRGIVYAEAECTNAVRVLTTTVRVENGRFPLVSVKSDRSLPKALLLQCMPIINMVTVQPPVRIGDILIENILNTGINIIATRNVDKNHEA